MRASQPGPEGQAPPATHWRWLVPLGGLAVLVALDRTLAGRLAPHHVQVTAAAAMRSSPLPALLGFLPPLLLGGFILFAVRTPTRSAGSPCWAPGTPSGSPNCSPPTTGGCTRRATGCGPLNARPAANHRRQATIVFAREASAAR